MSLEFVGAYTPIHHQYFQMVDMLIHHFRLNMKKLNPSAKPYVPQDLGLQNYETEENQQRQKHTKPDTPYNEWTEVPMAKRKLNKIIEEMPPNTNTDYYEVLQETNEEVDENDDEFNSSTADEIKSNEEINQNESKVDKEDKGLYAVDRITSRTLDTLMQQCDETKSDGEHYQSEKEVVIRQEHRDLEGHVMEIEEELRIAQTTSHYNTLFNYLNIQQNEYQYQRLNERNKELIEEWKMERLTVVAIRKNDEEQIQSFAEEKNRIILELKRKILKMKHYKTVDYEYENNREKG